MNISKNLTLSLGAPFLGVLLQLAPALGQALPTLPGQAVASAPAQSSLKLSNKQPVPLNQVPAPARQAITSQTGQNAVTVSKGTWSGTAYQVALNANGKRAYYQFTPDGSLLNNNPNHTVSVHLTNSKTITNDQMPPIVRQFVEQHGGLQSVIGMAQGTWTGALYEATAANSTQAPILALADGSLVSAGNMSEAAGAAAPQAQSQQTGTIAFKDLPWSVQKAMLDHTGYASIPSVTKTTLPDGRTAYTGAYQKDNQQQQITIGEDGSVINQQMLGTGTATPSVQPLSNSSKVQYSDLPAAVQKTARDQIGSATVEDIDKGQLNGQTVYELAYKKPGQSQTTELRIAEDGKVLGEHAD